MPFISSVRGNYGPQGRFGRALGLASSTGGTITTAGGYRIHTFLLADTGTNFVSSGSGTVEYLVIGGGGAGGEYGGGAGAGGYLTGTLAVSATSYPITVGEGFKHPSAGNYQNPGPNGGNSVFSSVTAIGGGGGGSWDGPNNIGAPGGSGGGQGGHTGGGGGGAGGAGGNGTSGGPWPGFGTSVGQGTPGQGFPGGRGFGDPISGPKIGGPGGIGLSSSITGSAVTRAGGGAGSTHQGTSQPQGGSGVGGNGAYGSGPQPQFVGTSGVENTGSGAGGQQDDNTSNATYPKGANGIVIIRYPI
jgi:hypothetical protein